MKRHSMWAYFYQYYNRTQDLTLSRQVPMLLSCIPGQSFFGTGNQSQPHAYKAGT